MVRWRYLALERPRLRARFRWRDRVLSSLGLALGIMFLIVSWGILGPVQEIARRKVLGSLPDRFRATGTSSSLGPLALGGNIDDAMYARAKSLDGIARVYRQAYFPEPCQARASYAGKSIVTDLVLEMCEEGQVAGDVASGFTFKDPGEANDMPIILPEYFLHLVNSGITVNTSLPQLSRQALIGRHLTLYLGTSSFKPGKPRLVRCVIVGVSDQIGAGGPVIPYEAGLRLSQGKEEINALTFEVGNPELLGKAVKAVTGIGLSTPRLAIAKQIDLMIEVLKLVALILPLAILLVTALGLAATLELQISKERQQIALYRVLGATPGEAASLYLLRSLSVALIGLVFGSVSGVLFGNGLALLIESKLPTDLIGQTSLFSPPAFAFICSAAFSFLTCLLAGWIPARSAAAIHPAQVFRQP